MRIQPNRVMLPFLACLALGAPVVAGVDGTPPTGVVVDEVCPDSAAAAAGMRTGDVILSWSRPSAPGDGRRSIQSPFELAQLEVEEAPRGEIVLIGERNQAETTWTLPPVPFGLRVRPALGPELLRWCRKHALVESAKLAASAEPWRQAARQAGDAIVSTWLLSRGA